MLKSFVPSCFIHKRQTRQEKGSILITALWLLAILTSMAMVVESYVRPQIDLVYKLKNKAQSYYLAESGIRKVMFQLSKEEPKQYSALNEDWNLEQKYKDIKLENGIINIGKSSSAGSVTFVQYGIKDEDSKINVNTVSKEIIQALLEKVGEISPYAAKDIAGSIINWRSPEAVPGEQCPDNSYYQSLSAPYKCKRSSIEIFDELILIKGMNQKLIDKIKDKITIYGSGAVNLNTTDSIVLSCLGISESLVDKIMRFRKGIDGKEKTKDDNIFKSNETIVSDFLKDQELSEAEQKQLTDLAAAGVLGTKSDYFMGTSVGMLNSNNYSTAINFVVSRNNEVKFWREE